MENQLASLLSYSILTHPFHNAIEYYWLNLFPECKFYFWVPGGKRPEGMGMRQHPPNYIEVDTIPEGIDFTVSHTQDYCEKFTSLDFPHIHWFHHLPYASGALSYFKAQSTIPVAVYLTPEARNLWRVGGEQVVCRHPIDVKRFQRWQGNIPRALMVASMPMKWWGVKKGLHIFQRVVESGIPMKLVGYNNEADWPQCEPEFVDSEERMIEIYRDYRVYCCTSPQVERSPLEALAAGMPVVMRRHEFNTLFDELHTTVPFVEGTAAFVNMVKKYVDWNQDCREIQEEKYLEQRHIINYYFSPEAVSACWQDAFSLCLGK